MTAPADAGTLTINLPLLEARYPNTIGYVRHVLAESRTVNIRSVEQYQVSARRTVPLYTLDDGQTVLITHRSNLPRPAGVTGVLRISKGGSQQWLSHQLLDAFDAKIMATGWHGTRDEIGRSWGGQFVFQAEAFDAVGNLISPGLRPPQMGALHAIGSHWSLYNQPATVVMPTGTGKTETMLAALVTYNPGPVLVVVPSEVLRNQTANKFATLGLLRILKNLGVNATNPIVGVVQRRPRSAADLEIFDDCNVVLTTMSAIAEGTAASLSTDIAAKTGTLIVDEAHHIAASGWSRFREAFLGRKILQFTATPYRRDGKLVDGKIIYEYPLHMAQEDGYFKLIHFEPIYELDQEDADEAIAEAAIVRVRDDLAHGFDHLVMARCERIRRGQELLAIYSRLAPDLQPILVHSETGDSAPALARLYARTSRIVIAVNMLGEGFDLPQLKIAAVHDTHKSLAVLLQFTGRFTRSAGANIGDATVIANIADQTVSSALERLYSEDADWNKLLSELSSEAAKVHTALMEFLNNSERLDEPDDAEKVEISHHLLRPMQNTLMYEAASFNPKNFFEGLPHSLAVHRVWLHEPSNTLYFVTRTEPSVKWTKSREIRDRQWDLWILHYDETQRLLFVSSSDKESTHEELAKAVGGTKLISGDVIFRSLGNISRLIFQNVGVRKYGRRNLRFAMYTGADVAEALSLSEKAGSVKSNVNGTGWENGALVAIGCSYKGRVWTREPGSIPDLNRWCEAVGKKILDDTIDTKGIIANVLIPKEVTALPDKTVLSVDWPIEILRQMEERVVLSRSEEELPVSLFSLDVVSVDIVASQINLRVRSALDDVWAELKFTVGGDIDRHVERVPRSAYQRALDARSRTSGPGEAKVSCFIALSRPAMLRG